MSQTREFAAEAKALSEQFGVDFSATRSLLAFMSSRIAASPIAQKIATSGTPEERSELFRAGVEEWDRQGRKFFEELLENRTPNSKKYREIIKQEVISGIKGVES